MTQPFGMFWVRDIILFSWGYEVIFDCLYDLGEPSKSVPFQLVLTDCRDMQWRVYAHLQHPEDRTLPATKLVNIHLGTEYHRKPMHLLTDSFGITVSYGTLVIQKITPPS